MHLMLDLPCLCGSRRTFHLSPQPCSTKPNRGCRYIWFLSQALGVCVKISNWKAFSLCPLYLITVQLILFLSLTDKKWGGNVITKSMKMISKRNVRKNMSQKYGEQYLLLLVFRIFVDPSWPIWLEYQHKKVQNGVISMIQLPIHLSGSVIGQSVAFESFDTRSWWVNFASRQVNFQLTCPDGQVEILWKTKVIKIMINVWSG